MKRFFPITCLALLCTTTLHAQQLVPATNEFRVNQHVPNTQRKAQIDVGPDDGYVITWVSLNQNGNPRSLLCRRYNAAHQVVTDEMLVSTDVATAENAKVLHWTANRFVIVWGAATGLGMRVLNADNTMEAAGALVGGVQWDFAIQGNTLVTLSGAGTGHLSLRAFDLLTNTAVGSAVQATEDGANSYESPAVRFQSDGSLVAVYGRGNYPNIIYRKTFDGDLLAQIPETQVYGQQASLNCIDIDINAHDEILIGTKWGVNGTDVWRAWVLDAAGNTLVNGLTVGTSSYGYYSSECTLYDNGDFIVVMGNKLSLNDPDDYQIRGYYGRNYNAQNSGVVVLNTTAAQDQSFPAVEKRSDGGFMVVWHGNGFQGDAEGINARAWHGASFPGLVSGTVVPIVVDETGTSQQLAVRLGTQPTGNVLVDIAVSDPTEAVADLAQLTFTTTNWSQLQYVTITGVDDPEDDGDITLQVTAGFNAATADPTYAGLGPQVYALVNRDDDATLNMPAAQIFCRSAGLVELGFTALNNGGPLGSPSATSGDQEVVDDADISVVQTGPTTFAVSIADLEDNSPGTTTITLSVTDGAFIYSEGFTVTTQGVDPVITWTGAELMSSAASNYQWYLNGELIEGADAQSWVPVANGNYTVVITDANGCSATSAVHFFGSTGIDEANGSSIAVYPQPAMDHVFIAGAQAGDRFRLLDAQGRLLNEGAMQYTPFRMDLDGLSSGMHVIVITGDRHTTRLPVVVQ